MATRGVKGIPRSRGGRRQPRVVASAEVGIGGYVSLRALSAYAGLSVRLLRRHLTDPTRPLPHYRLGGKILVRRDEFDDWIRQFRHGGFQSEPAP